MKKTLAQRVVDRIRAGALVVVVQEADEILALAEVEPGAELCEPVQDPVSAANMEILDKIKKHATEKGTLIVMDLLAMHGENPYAVRLVREIALQQREAGVKASRLILIEQPATKIPAGLSGDVEVIRSPLPDQESLRAELDAFIAAEEIKLEGSDDEKQEKLYSLANAVTGLARHEAGRLFCRSWTELEQMDPAWLRNEKAARVTQRLQGALTFETVDCADVGGMEDLRAWLKSRKKAFGSQKARDFGLSEPKGALLCGVPGAGKSLVAKTIAKQWGLPLLRLDPGKLFGSLVGQSESQTRLAIEAAEACAPCVFWIDEIEKGFGNSGSLDGGTTSRVFGTLLTWMNDKTSPVYVIATANRPHILPPELIRKGRFDEIWFVGLPDPFERREIINIHLNRRHRAMTELEVSTIAEATDGFSGSEIEQVIVDALFTAFDENERNLYVDDVLDAAKATQPLSKTAGADIESIIAWSKGKARPASGGEKKKVAAGRYRGGKIDKKLEGQN